MTTTARAPRNQGSNWIRRAKRAAIYAADGHRCVYCGTQVSAGNEHGRASVAGTALATLDHIVAVDNGGDNSTENLLTSCLACNSGKANEHLGAYLARRNPQLLVIAAAILGGAL